MDRSVSVPHSAAQQGGRLPPGVQRAGGDRLGAGHAEKGGPGTAGPLGAGAPPGELPAGDAMLPWMLHGSALVWDASKAVVPGEHWLPQMVAVGDVKAQPLAWLRWACNQPELSRAGQGTSGATEWYLVRKKLVCYQAI